MGSGFARLRRPRPCLAAAASAPAQLPMVSSPSPSRCAAARPALCPRRQLQQPPQRCQSPAQPAGPMQPLSPGSQEGASLEEEPPRQPVRQGNAVKGTRHKWERSSRAPLRCGKGTGSQRVASQDTCSAARFCSWRGQQEERGLLRASPSPPCCLPYAARCGLLALVEQRRP